MILNMTCELPRLALQLAYDGGDFSGFMALPGKRTVQGEFEAALQRLLKSPCPTEAAGRTDAGVHAYGQILSLSAELPFKPERLPELLGRQLPPDMTVKNIWSVPEDFHARFSARARHYRYRLHLNAIPDPFSARYAWQYPHPIDPYRLESAWRQCLGRHDFKTFARSGGSRRSTEISVWLAELRELDGEFCLDIVADSFLYSMVRNLVGTALDIARDRLCPDAISRRLAGDTRQPEGITAPPQGLHLCRALYATEFGVTPEYPHPVNDDGIPPAALKDPGKWWA